MESATSGLRFAPMSTGLRVVISCRIIRTVSAVTLIAEFWNETINPVASEPEYSNRTPVTVVPKDILGLS
jgi:hypothetical protein